MMRPFWPVRAVGRVKRAGPPPVDDVRVRPGATIRPTAWKQAAVGRAADGKIAGTIEKAQGPEIKTMTGWLKSWNEPTGVASVPGMEHGDGDGMMADSDMEHLRGMEGAEFDKMFAAMMIEHHDGAISMARAEQRTA
jgi:uncharacterized protein (DUF305 family)